jgi:hypothetical protein
MKNAAAAAAQLACPRVAKRKMTGALVFRQTDEK